MHEKNTPIKNKKTNTSEQNTQKKHNIQKEHPEKHFKLSCLFKQYFFKITLNKSMNDTYFFGNDIYLFGMTWSILERN
jgi:hypothetical protein